MLPAKRKTTEEFIKEAISVHGDKYDYSEVEYKNNHTKVPIICPIHGTYMQTPYNHVIQGSGCPSCAGNAKKRKKRRRNRKDGKKYVYNKPKKRGRKLKRGRPFAKSGKIYIDRRKRFSDFVITITKNKRAFKYIFSCKTEEEAYFKFNELIRENKKINLPVRIVRNVENKSRTVPTDTEILLLKRNKEDEDNETLIRDEMGILRKNTVSNTTEWLILDKSVWNEEERYYIYGIGEKHQRKDVVWIYENILVADKVDKQLLLFKNKIIISTFGEKQEIELIVCKTKSEAVRLYNFLHSLCMKDRIRYILFYGNINKSVTKHKWIGLIKEKTGWADNRINSVGFVDCHV
jgi:hypothetical protein